VFFVRNSYKFPDFIHIQKRHPKTNLRSPTAMWDFWSLSPESLHHVTILMSDRGLPTDVRHMNPKTATKNPRGAPPRRKTSQIKDIEQNLNTISLILQTQVS
jgi:hypothetical protein